MQQTKTNNDVIISIFVDKCIKRKKKKVEGNPRRRIANRATFTREQSAVNSNKSIIHRL